MTPQQRNLLQITGISLKLGCIGFGGIAGMVGLMETEFVVKRKWITRDHYLDIVGTANLIPGPNAVEIIMHCAREKAGRTGLITAGILYILPSMLICLLWGYLYIQYGHLPAVQPYLYGIAPATTAIIASAVARLSKASLKSGYITFLSVVVLIGSLCGLNDILLLFGAGIAGTLYKNKSKLSLSFLPPLLFVNNLSAKLFFSFLKVGAILYGSGYVLLAYLNDTLVEQHHWLTRQQLVDAISVGQITPGPILSTATFAGYIIDGTRGAIIATIGIFLPSFFIALFLYRLLNFINRHILLRNFLDVVNGASVALIVAVALQMTGAFIKEWRADMIFAISLSIILFTKINPAWVIVLGSILGYFLLQI